MIKVSIMVTIRYEVEAFRLLAVALSNEFHKSNFRHVILLERYLQNTNRYIDSKLEVKMNVKWGASF